MLINVLRVLRGAGVEAEPEGHDLLTDAYVRIDVDGRSTLLAMDLRKRAPYPGEIDRLAGPRKDGAVATIVAPYITEEVGRTLSENELSWIDTHGNMSVVAPGIRLKVRRPGKPKQSTSTLPAGSAATAVIRSIIHTGAVNGVGNLAAQIGTSQPRVSQVLHQLLDAGLVDRVDRSNWKADREAILRTFLAEYNGPGGSTAYYYSLKSPVETAEIALGAPAHSESRAVVSGDVAADRLLAWRVPTAVRVYVATPTQVDDARLGMVEATDSSDSNVEIVMPQDRSVFLKATGIDSALAHPTQVIWDMMRSNDDDRLEAAERLIAWYLSR